MMLLVRNLPKLVPLLRSSLSFSVQAQSCVGEAAFQASDCEQSSTDSSMGNKHAAELDVVLHERCPTSGTTSWTPNLIN